ncbi:MAG: AMP-binding protein, partial [Rhodoferax sp.]|nr:AMP-binding protein [Rhodoferax sp.]
MTAHIDTFARDRLPPPALMPELIFELPALQFPALLNTTAALLDRRVAEGDGDRPAVLGTGVHWSYADLQAQANRIARVLTEDLGLVPGNRVLLRGANTPMLAACFLGVFKAGGIAVGTMPLLRARELQAIVDKAQISHALCDNRLAAELDTAQQACPTLKHRLDFMDGALESAMTAKPASFEAVPTEAEDIALMAFTSGTTGVPKGTMHTHRDILAACACWPPHVLRPVASDVFIGSPPLAFTFGLGGLLLFPLSVGASTVLLEKATPDVLPAAIA